MLPFPAPETEEAECKGSIVTPQQRQPRHRDVRRLNDWSAGDEPVHDYDNGNDQQQVDKAATYVHYEETKHPQDKKNYRDRPKHYGILARSE